MMCHVCGMNHFIDDEIDYDEFDELEAENTAKELTVNYHALQPNQPKSSHLETINRQVVKES